jgi:hypothetical protein
MRDEVTTPEFEAACFVTCKDDVPKNPSVVIRAIELEDEVDHPVVLVLNEGLVTKLFFAMCYTPPLRIMNPT